MRGLGDRLAHGGASGDNSTLPASLHTGSAALTRLRRRIARSRVAVRIHYVAHGHDIADALLLEQHLLPRIAPRRLHRRDRMLVALSLALSVSHRIFYRQLDQKKRGLYVKRSLLIDKLFIEFAPDRRHPF
jgi:hypothetical protein